MDSRIMTLAEFKVDLWRETGAQMSRAAWYDLYSQYVEQESEAIAGGKYDVDPEIVLQAQCEAWSKMRFQVFNNYITYHPSTDATGSARMLVGGFDTREAAEKFVASHYTPGEEHDDEQWFTVFPPRPYVLPVAPSLDECPF